MTGSAAGNAAEAPPHQPDGPWHEAFPWSSASGLATAVSPRIAVAVAAGDPVVAVVTDEVRDELRVALGDDADAVDFQDFESVHHLPAFTVAVRWARTTRRIGTTGGRSLVVGQQLHDGPPYDMEHWARLCLGLDAATDGLPITVLCGFPSDTPHAAGVRSRHPLLNTPDGPRESPTYRDPGDAIADHPPPPPPPLGEPTAELLFDLERLTRLRHLVAEVGAAAGLSPDRVADLVLVVNELASNSVEHGPGWGRLRMWAGDGVVAEVADDGRMDVPFPGMAFPPPSGVRGRGLWLASELSDVLQVWSRDRSVIRIRVGVGPQ